MAAAKRRVARLDIDAYAAKAKKYVAEKNLSKRANEEMRIYNLTMKVNRLEMLKAEIGIHLVDGFTDLDQYVSETLNGRTTDELKRQAGILGKIVSGNDTLVHSIVNASFHNATFSDRIWMHQALLKSELDKQLQQGLIAGKHPQVLARDIRKAFNVSRSNAERLMRTELARVQTDAQMRSFEENGFEWYMFLSLGSRACEVCRALNGKKFKVKDMLDGENAPPIHPNCRCSTAAAMDRDEYGEWLDGYKEHGLSFDEWERRVEEGKYKAPKNSKEVTPMYRHREYTNRKQGSSGFKIIDKPLYKKLTKAAMKKGADIRIADEHWKKRLAEVNASAVTIGQTIIFTNEPTVTDVLEEIHHFYQNKAELNGNYPAREQSILNEIEAKEYLISVAERYKIPVEETMLTKKQLESYKNEMARLKELGEWNEGS